MIMKMNQEVKMIQVLHQMQIKETKKQINSKTVKAILNKNQMKVRKKRKKICLK